MANKIQIASIADVLKVIKEEFKGEYSFCRFIPRDGDVLHDHPNEVLVYSGIVDWNKDHPQLNRNEITELRNSIKQKTSDNLEVVEDSSYGTYNPRSGLVLQENQYFLSICGIPDQRKSFYVATSVHENRDGKMDRVVLAEMKLNISKLSKELTALQELGLDINPGATIYHFK